MHPTLIRANIALYLGERAETLRLLGEYRSASLDEAHDAMIAWLEAEAQTDPDERGRLLSSLMANAPADDPYARLARDYLQAEADYAALQQPRRAMNKGVLVLVLVLVTGLGIFVASQLFSPANPPPAADQPILSVLAALTPTPPPDNSRALMAETFIARYDSGILQLKAFEDRSERVINAETGARLVAIPGARFFTLELNFECRSSICDVPPQAELRLQLDNERLLEYRADALVAGEAGLQPVALGRATTGWLVFEVPLLNRVESVHITPLPVDGEVFDPLIIELPPW
jgi:hypothetical protein